MKRVDQVIEYLILGILILIPLFYDPNIYVTFDLSKALLLRFLSLILLAFVSFRIIFYPFAFKRIGLYPPVIAFFISSITSTIFSVSPWQSLLGTYRRFEGLIAIMSYIFLFFVVTNFVSPLRINRFLKTIVIVGTIASIKGIFEGLSGTYPLCFFGNQNFLAAYLVLSIPFSFFLSFQSNRLWISTFIIMVFCLLLTRTRGAYLAFFISMPLFFILTGKGLLKRIEVKAILGILLFAFLILSLNPATSPIQRILGTFKVSKQGIAFQGTALERLYLWKAGFKTMLAYPLTGCGIEAMRLAYAKFEEAELEVVGGHNVKADRSHNETVDMGVTRGIPGLIIYIWLWITIIVLSLRIKNRLLSASFLASLIAYFVQCQFNFSMISYTTTFWILLSLLCLALREQEKKKLPLAKPKFSPGRIILFVCCLLSVVCCLILTIPIYKADVLFKNAVHYKERGQFDNAIQYAEEALKKHPKEPYYYETLCESLFMKAQFAETKEKQREWVNRAFIAADKALSITPTNGFFYNLLGGLHTLLYFSGDEKERDLAIKEYRHALELIPVFIEPYLNLAIIYKKEGDIDKAMYCYKKILEFNPEHPEALISLSDIYYQKHDIKNALIFFEKTRVACEKAILNDPTNKKIPPILKYAESMISIIGKTPL
ncbi:MAG: O-antigen ligase family protein [bacterium]